MGEPSKTTPVRKRRRAISPESRELQIAAAAYDLAEQQILDGTASSQIITQFLKIGSTRERYELERLRRENELLKKKAENLESTIRSEELYEKAIAAMRTYAGYGGEEDYD